MSDNLKFTVMPDLEGIGRMPASIPQAPVPPKASGAKPVITDQVQEHHTEAVADRAGNRKRYLIMALAAFLLLGLATAGFAFWQNNKSNSSAENPAAYVTPPVVEDNKDSDNDGLTDTEEQNLGTDPNIADTDGDGLADGDEVKLFKTSPISMHSDSDAFDDGTEVKNGYNPTIGGDARISQEEIDMVSAAYSRGELHSVTAGLLTDAEFWKGSLYLPAPESNEAPQQTVPEEISAPKPPGEQYVYEDTTYGYQLILPGKWKKSGTNPTNLVFTEQNSPDAMYVQIQSFVGVDPEGEISNAGLLENEIKRLASQAISGVTYTAATVSGISSSRLAIESRRDSASGQAPLLTSIVEYIIDHTPEAFMVTISCTSNSGQSCMTRANSLAQEIEKGLLF